MSQFLYVSLFLAAFSSPLHAMDEYEHTGNIFKDQRCAFKSEIKDGEHSKKFFPKDPALCAATVEYLNSTTVLHHAGYEWKAPGFKIRSFAVAPNLGLATDSTDFSSLSKTPYALIPVQYNGYVEEIKLQIEENSTQDNYATTLAGALKILLNEFIPSPRVFPVFPNWVPSNFSVTICDSNEKLGELVSSEDFCHLQYFQRTVFQAGAKWKATFNLR